MVILDEGGRPVEDPDLERGYVVQVEDAVTHEYVVDAEEAGHYEVVAEYPNGGRDVEFVVDRPRAGHWETRGADGRVVELFDREIPADWAGCGPVGDVWRHGVYIKYTPEELEGIECERAAEEAERTRAAQERRAISMLVRMGAGSMSDEEARGVSMLFPEWSAGARYAAGEVFRRDGGLYRVVRDIECDRAERSAGYEAAPYVRIG